MGAKRKAPAGAGGKAAASKKAKKPTAKKATAKSTGKSTGNKKKAVAAAATGAKKSTNANATAKPKPKPKPKTKGQAPQLPENGDDVDVDEDDVAFFEQHAQSASFLVNMDTKRLAKGMFTKPKQVRLNQPKLQETKETKETKETETKETKDDEPLEKMEARPRRAGWSGANKVDLASKLPVKFMDGSVRPNKLLHETTQDKAKAKASEMEAEDDDMDPNHMQDIVEDLDSELSDMEFEEIHAGEDETEETDETNAPVTPVDLRVQRQRRLAEKKIQMAHLCESILESPEDAMKKNKDHADGLSKVQELHALCEDPDATVQKLAMLSELSVFLDILPDYRIRLQQQQQAETEKSHNGGRPMKKKVQQMQDFEASMLHNYQLFLKHCAQVVKDGVRGKGPTHALSARDTRDLALAETGAKCLGELLKAKYAFNFHLNLIVALVPMADSHFVSIRTVACEAFASVYQSDKTCVATLDIVKQISSYVKQKEHRVKPDIIKTFLRMPLDVTMEQGEASRKKAKSDRKKRRKLQNDGDTIASGLKEAEAVVDRSERDKTQADILHELVLIYFRVLKQATYSTALPAVLEGLAKFAFLINLEIMVDLMKVLKAVLKQDILPLASAFQAVLTGLRTLQGPGQELLVDDKEFVDILYTLLRRFSEGEDVACFDVALQCVEAVFLRRKEIVVDRVAAFIKRLLLTSLSLQPHQVLAVLALVRSLLHRYNKLQQLLESDVDRVASGEYRADVDDPDFTNPYSTACWELALLARHYHPAVAAFAKGTAELGPSLPNETPRAMLDTYHATGTQMYFLPKVPVPPRNPLYAKMAQHLKREQNKKRQRQRKFFVSDPIAEKVQRASPFLSMCLQVDTTTDTELQTHFDK